MTSHLARFARTFCAIAASAVVATACTTAPGPTLAEAVPNLEQRTGAPLNSALPWDKPNVDWDGCAPLTAEAALATALQNNRALRRALVQIDMHRAHYQDAQLPPNPTLDLAAGVPLDMGAAPILAMISAQIDWLWKREALVGEADAVLRSALFDAAALTVATAAETRGAYVEVASAQEAVLFAHVDVGVAARVLEATTEAFDSGEATATQVNDARMEWSDATMRSMNAGQSLLVAKTRLLRAIGRGDLDLNWKTAAATAVDAAAECALPVAPQPQDQADFMALVRERRLDLRAAQARVEGAEARLALAKAGRWPSVMLGGGWERDMEGDSAVMLEAQVALPIFNQGQFRVRVAEAELETARIDADAQWQQALLDAHRTLGALAVAEHHLVQLRDVTLAASYANKKILSDMVNAGEAAPVQLWRSVRAENGIRTQLAQAQRDRVLAAIGFERSLAGARLPGDRTDQPGAGGINLPSEGEGDDGHSIMSAPVAPAKEGMQ